MRPVNALVDLMSRIPARVQVKLFGAFLAIEVLLVLLGAVALQVLAGVSDRTDELIRLQRKIEAYRQVQNDTTSQLYGVSAALLSSDDRTLSSALRQLNQFGYDVDRLQFVARDEVELLDQFRQDYDRFTDIVSRVVELIRAGRAAEARDLQTAQAGPISDRLERLTNQLVNKAEADMVTGIETANQAYGSSRWIVVGFALGSILLAVVLGYVISSSVIGPVTEVETRLGRIAAGDFSQRVHVANRDELGALAHNVNRMCEELGRLYQQLEAANLAKSRFIAAASHDLRQPLHALNLFATQLRSETDPAENARVVARINAAVTAMNELFDALLDISRLDAGVLVPKISEFPVDQLLKRIETTFTPVAREKGLRLRVVSSKTWARSDFILLERILLNLVSNAIRYTADGGVIVGCRRRGRSLRFEIWDSGSGIPDDQRDKIFNEFYQVASDKPERRSGLGLGLAIVDRLCRLLDHPIELNSRVGSGSRFGVSVPSAAPKRVVQYPQAVVTDHAAGKLVVVIDDDTLVLHGMAGVLKSWGCHVVAVTSDDEALASLGEDDRQPDLIISDYQLSDGKTGFAAIGRLRDAFGIQIPAFLISGDTAPERLREATASGYYLLHKPVLPMRLRSLVNQLLKDGNNGTGPQETVPSPRSATDPELAATASPMCLPQ